MTEFEATDIAIIATACRFPGAETPDQYWKNLKEGIESLQTLSEEAWPKSVPRAWRDHPNYRPTGGFLDDIEYFDANFFGLSSTEADLMDPQHRLFLEVCWEAFERSGHLPEDVEGPIGIFGGSGFNAYMPYNLFTRPDIMQRHGLFLVRHTGNDKDFLTTRASYIFDLKGPAVNVQTACSTSLVAVHLAAQSLINHECDMALAGGVTIEMPQRVGYLYEEGEILSPDGKCRAFDADSKGVVFGSGCGVVVLKRAQDAVDSRDNIVAILKGSAVNNDGKNKVGYLAPSVDGQAEAILEAIAVAGIDANDISYVECHGTGTPVGDPIEVKALTQAFRESTEDKDFCRIGSVKPNIGHLDTAAGVASLIKAALMLKHQSRVPSLHFKSPNPSLNLESSPFSVQVEVDAWPSSEPRFAGVSSLGVGGTNAHVILSEAPKAPAVRSQIDSAVLVCSAESTNACLNTHNKLKSFIADHSPHLDDTEFTLRTGRRTRRFRSVFITDQNGNTPAIESRVFDAKQHRTIALMFPGGGSQHSQMWRGLETRLPNFAAHFSTLKAVAKNTLGIDLEQDEGSNLWAQPHFSLTALVAFEIALARTLEDLLGDEIHSMIGHSAGEYAVAHLAGVFSLEDTLRIVHERGRLFETLPKGSMLSVNASEKAVLEILGEELDIASINGQELVVVAGTIEALKKFDARAAEQKIKTKKIHIDVAAHSSMLEPIIKPFAAFLDTIDFQAPQKRWVSNLSAENADPLLVCQPEYWVNHLRHTVRFFDGISFLQNEASKNSDNILMIEVGPGQGLSSLAELAGLDAQALLPPPRSDLEAKHQLLHSLGQLWARGCSIDLQKVHSQSTQARRISLPTYAFDRERHFVEAGDTHFMAHESSAPLGKRTWSKRWFYQPTWEPTEIISAQNQTPEESLLLGWPQPTSDTRRLISWEAWDKLKTPGEKTLALFGASASPKALKIIVAFEHDFLEPQLRAFEIATLLGNAAIENLQIVWAFENPYHRGLQAFASTWPNELEGVNSSCVQVERFDGTTLSALEAEGDEPRAIRYETAGRHIEVIRSMSQEPLAAARKAAHYLIIGGLSGIVQTLIPTLIQRGATKLTLSSRRIFPPQETWPALIAERERQDPYRQQLESLQAFAKKTELRFITLDVCDLQTPLPTDIDGLVYAAGHIDDAPLSLKNEARFQAVLASKGTGLQQILSALDVTKLKHCILFSSTSAWLGAPGQVDYAAANLELLAIADRLRATAPKVCTQVIAWGPWRDIGMAHRSIRGGHTKLGTPLQSRFLQSIDSNSAQSGSTQRRFLANYSSSTLIEIRHHGIVDGPQVLPGTAYFQLISDLRSLKSGEFLPLTISNLQFKAPVAVHDGNTLPVTILDDGASGSLELTEDLECATWQYRGMDPTDITYPKYAKLIERLEREGSEPKLQQSQDLQFGPSWEVVERVHLGEKDAVVLLHHPSSPSHHPFAAGVLDLATGAAFSLAAVPPEHFWAPLSYGKIEMHRPLTERVYAHVRSVSHHPKDKRATFSAHLFDPAGNILVVIEEYVTAAVPRSVFKAKKRRSSGEMTLEEAMTQEEGLRSFKTILEQGIETVLVSPVSFPELKSRYSRPRAQVQSPEIQTAPGQAPQNEAEAVLQRLFSELLGVDTAKRDDDFFELGGHSLTAVRLLTRTKKSLGVDLPLSLLLQKSTFGELADHLSSMLGLGPAKADAHPDISHPSFEYLIQIQQGSSIPLILVHGAGGNVLNFSELAKSLGRDQSLWGVQAKGVDGLQQPHNSIEAMVAAYGEEIEELDLSRGFYLGGYSGGGIVALALAEKLANKGSSPRGVILLDTFHPQVSPRRLKLRDHLKRTVERGPGYLRERAAASLNRSLESLSTDLKIRYFEGTGQNLPFMLRDMLLYRNFHSIASKYIPPSYSNRVTLFRAAKIAEVYAHTSEKLGWDEILTALSVIEIPGDHDSLVRAPNVQILAEQLKTILKA